MVWPTNVVSLTPFPQCGIVTISQYTLLGLFDSLDSRTVFQTDSLVSGPLSSTSTFLAKVATSPQNDTPNYSHLICVYMPDVYDQGSVTEVREPGRGGLPSVPSSCSRGVFYAHRS